MEGAESTQRNDLLGASEYAETNEGVGDGWEAMKVNDRKDDEEKKRWRWRDVEKQKRAIEVFSFATAGQCREPEKESARLRRTKAEKRFEQVNALADSLRSRL